MTIRAVFCTLILTSTTLAAPLPAAESNSTVFRTIPIPEEEHGYHRFASTVIGSQAQLDDFLHEQVTTQHRSWNQPAAFEQALSQAGLDFSRERLVLLRHTESSGSVGLDVLPPQIVDTTLVFRIERHEPEVQTADMAFYGFALVVSKSAITEVALQIENRETVVFPLGD